MGSSNEHIVDIEQISTSIEKELEILHPLSDECCIYRVPNILRRSNEEAYTPQEVSIGPLHHGRPELKPMEEIKRRYLQEFLLLSNSTMSLKEYVKFIEERETKLRNCYAETIEMNSEDLVKMILIDSAFLIMVFLKFSCKELQTGNDRLFSKPWKEFDVRYDMILLGLNSNLTPAWCSCVALGACKKICLLSLLSICIVDGRRQILRKSRI